MEPSTMSVKIVEKPVCHYMRVTYSKYTRKPGNGDFSTMKDIMRQHVQDEHACVDYRLVATYINNQQTQLAQVFMVECSKPGSTVQYPYEVTWTFAAKEYAYA